MAIKAKFFHNRVPASRLNPTKGKPKDWLLLPYSRKNGWANDDDLSNMEVASRGGFTYCMLVDEEDLVIGSGKALCSFSQNFSYWEGRRISQNRAIDIAIMNGLADVVREAGLSKLYYQDAAQNPIADGSEDRLDLEL